MRLSLSAYATIIIADFENMVIPQSLLEIYQAPTHDVSSKDATFHISQKDIAKNITHVGATMAIPLVAASKSRLMGSHEGGLRNRHSLSLGQNV
jgi:hypothetical protein